VEEEAMSGVVEPGTCDHCGRVKPNLELMPDPYIAEIFPEDENEESWWCDECYLERQDAI